MRQRRRGGNTKPQQLVTIELAPVIWQALQDIAAQQSRSVSDLVAEIAHDSLHLAIHAYIAEFYRDEFPDGDTPGNAG